MTGYSNTFKPMPDEETIEFPVLFYFSLRLLIRHDCPKSETKIMFIYNIFFGFYSVDINSVN